MEKEQDDGLRESQPVADPQAPPSTPSAGRVKGK
jgi:hypothetical protein